MITLSRHARIQCRRRHNHIREFKAALDKGAALWVRGVYKVAYGNLRVVVTLSGLVVTAYRRPNGSKRKKDRGKRCTRN